MSEDKIEFVDGLYFKPPVENAPKWAHGSISIKRAVLENWLRGKDDEWINVDVKTSRAGKVYCAVSTFVPKKQETPPQREPGCDDEDPDGPPF